MDSPSPSMNVIRRFADVAPEDFRNEVDKLWEAGRQVVNTIVEQVEDQSITPLQGLGIIGCTTSQLYAVNAFHGDASPVDLLASLDPRGTPLARG